MSYANALSDCVRHAFAAWAATWRAHRGNPAITYRYGVGQTFAGATITRRCWCDERYDMSDGSTRPGYGIKS